MLLVGMILLLDKDFLPVSFIVCRLNAPAFIKEVYACSSLSLSLSLSLSKKSSETTKLYMLKVADMGAKIKFFYKAKKLYLS